jgi:hypothetical protein
MPQREARDEAIRRARERLEPLAASGGPALGRRGAALGLPSPAGGAVEFRLFGRDARLDLGSLDLRSRDGSAPSQAELILFYHYLACEAALSPGGEPVSFRDFPGGIFYWEPFRARSCLPLARRYGADLARGAPELRAALDRFDWSGLALGDFGARVHGFGSLYLIIAAYAPEEGLDAEVNVLFEGAARRAFGAEDAAAFASRICLELVR